MAKMRNGVELRKIPPPRIVSAWNTRVNYQDIKELKAKSRHIKKLVGMAKTEIAKVIAKIYEEASNG
jgi:hypothetical protein